MQDEYPSVDYLFAGAGASSTLMLMSMEKRGLLKDKVVVIVDRDTKQNNDKTYCFWSDQQEQISQYCKHLINHHWDEISVNQQRTELLSPKKYFHIPGLNVYNELRRISEDHNLKRINGNVLHLEPCVEGVTVKTDAGTWNATWVFDSRPPEYSAPEKYDVHLLQSFVGYVIKSESPLSDINCVDLMDFNVDQQDHTQFMYVLPLSNHTALVELTRFGKTPVTQAEAEPVLHTYISKRFGDYTIKDVERGCIPMSTLKITPCNIPGVIAIGGRAGAIKPSTGYAFKNMFHHAEKTVDALLKNDPPAPIPVSWRFRLYDRLLLMILNKQPSKGKLIFQSLFKKNSVKKVLKFLDEKTTVQEDAKIFLSLPFKPFLQALGYIVFTNLIRNIKPVLLLLISVLFIVVDSVGGGVLHSLQIIIFIAGLFIVGIPHGAVDHLIETGNFNGSIRPVFIFKYLGVAALNLLLWFFFPNVALVFFLTFSAWHFGETDLKEWKLKWNNIVVNFAIGFTILSIILFGHVNETNNILENMQVWKLPIGEAVGKSTALMIGISALVGSVFIRSTKMFMCVLMLIMGMQLPLITCFGLYFIGQHSMNGWSHLKQGMKMNDRSLYIKALPFTCGAFLLFALMIFLLQMNVLSDLRDHWISLFFIFISCISFPHVISMSRFYKGFRTL